MTNKRNLWEVPLDELHAEVDDLMGLGTQHLRGELPPCVVLLEDEWNVLRTYIRRCRNVEKELKQLWEGSKEQPKLSDAFEFTEE